MMNWVDIYNSFNELPAILKAVMIPLSVYAALAPMCVLDDRRREKLLEEFESIDIGTLNPDSGKRAIVIYGSPNKGGVICHRGTDAVAKLLRINGFDVAKIEPERGDNGQSLIKAVNEEQNGKTKRLVIYHPGHGNREGAADLPPPAETISLLRRLDDIDVELVIDTCEAGPYVEEARRQRPQNAKVFASTDERQCSFGYFGARVLRKAKSKGWRFNSMGEIMPKMNSGFPSYLAQKPIEMFDYVRGKLNGKRPYFPMGSNFVQKYSPSSSA